MTDIYAVFGNPIAQSKSPFIHMSFAKVSNQDMDYGRIEAPLEAGGFEKAVDDFRAQGAKGINITAPFKMQAFAYADKRSERAELVGAANCLKFEGDTVYADNFDGIGLVRDIVHNLGFAIQGKRILLLGAGGAARGALLPILEERPALVVIANRSLAKGVELQKIAEQSFSVPIKAMSLEDCAQLTEGFDLVMNATSSSLFGAGLPLPDAVFKGCTLAYDLSYGKGLTPFLKQAKDNGVPTIADGVGMLAEQAAEAFEWWRGVRPDTQAVIQALTVPLV